MWMGVVMRTVLYDYIAAAFNIKINICLCAFLHAYILFITHIRT